MRKVILLWLAALLLMGAAPYQMGSFPGAPEHTILGNGSVPPSRWKAQYATATQLQSLGSYTFSADALDSLATMDFVQFHMALFNDDHQPAYAGIVDKLRARNRDIIVMDYLYVWGVEDPWVAADSTWTAGDIRHDLWTFVDDNDYWMKNSLGIRVAAYPTDPASYLINMFANRTVTEAFAQFFADYINSSPNSQKWTGVFLDYFDAPDYANWPCYPGGNCRNIIDINENGVPYYLDAADQVAMITGQQTFLTELRARVHNKQLLILANGSAHYKDDDTAALLDGGMYEEIHLYWPNTALQWEQAIVDQPGKFNTSVVDNPILIYDVIGYSEDIEEKLVAASMIAGGTAQITNEGGVTRRFWSLEESTLGRISLGAPIPGGVDYKGTGDAYRQYERGYVKFAPDVVATGGYWDHHFIVVDTTAAKPDTLLVSDGWATH